MRFAFKLVDEPYYRITSVHNLIHYVTHDKKTHLLLDYIGSPNTDISKATEQFLYVKQHYNKMSGRQMRQFVVSFNKKCCISSVDAYYIGMMICRFYAERYQIVFGVHQDTDNIHIHFALNTVSYVDGKKYREGYEDCFKLEGYVEYCVNKYVSDLFKGVYK